MLGYRGNPEWRDMSEYLVHFTKESHIDDSVVVPAGKNLASILQAASVRRGFTQVGQARGLDNLSDDARRAVCFSEIPLDLLARLVARRSSYGIGFTKEFVASAGGAPVWYPPKDGTPARAFQALKETKFGPIDPDDPLWEIAVFVDMPGDYDGVPYFFEWEREWRTRADLTFKPADVAFLFLPAEKHDRVRQDLAGMGFGSPLIDPLWPMDKIQDAVGVLPTDPGHALD